MLIVWKFMCSWRGIVLTSCNAGRRLSHPPLPRLPQSFRCGLLIYHAVQNTERANNLLIGALKHFPMEYIFNVVYRLKEVGISSQDAAHALITRPDCR